MTVPAGGISSQFGMVDEPTFGVSPTVTRFLEFNDESIQKTVARLESSGLRVGRKVQRASQFVPSDVDVSGDINFEVQQQGFGLVIKHLLGNIASAQPNVGSNPTVWEHTGTVGQLDGKSFTCQVAKAGSDGVQRAFTYRGCKFAKWDLSCSVGSLLMLKPTVDGVDETTATAMAAATYPSGVFPLGWANATITLPGGAVGNVSKFDLTGDTQLNLARRFMGATTAFNKKEQLEGANLRAYAGSIDVEWADLSAYNLFLNGTTGVMTAMFEGPVISGSYNYALEVTLGAVRFDGQTPNVSGPDVVNTAYPWEWYYDGTNLPKIEIIEVQSTAL